MIDSLTVGGIVLEKDVPDVIDSENNLIYEFKTMTNSRLKDKKDMIDAITIGGLCQPLIFAGVDWGKKPDGAGRATYWLVPFKYKTAGFKFCNIRSDFGGLVWRFQDYYGINLKDLPINYNFEMAKRFYTNPFQEFNTLLLNKMHDEVKKYINSMYGIERKGIPIAKDIKFLISIPRMPMPDKTYYLWWARGCMKPFLKPTIITVKDLGEK